RWVGHSAVAVLDGGMAAWQSQGLPMSTDVPVRAPGTIADQAPLVAAVSANDVLDRGGRTVIDARAPDRFRGENETLDPVGGHIPGAKNRFFKDNLEADGRFKSAEQLKAGFAPLLGDPKAAVMQCGSGVTACHNLFALCLAGYALAPLYAGSWSEWITDPARPIATGD
ncbi:sulfurtransferase, partial [Pseudomonas sp.]|uniref:sulfurtransferase n=1 Tax=Pseudomonas sp. TaxID=306 RepID=UPI003BB4D256